MAYIEDQLRHLALWTEQLSDSWSFFWETAIVGLARPQPENHSLINPPLKHTDSFYGLCSEEY